MFSLAALLQLLIPFVATAAVAAVKKILPRVPKVVLPVLAPVAGVAIALATGYTDAQGGALLGAAGVAVREVYDQVKKALASV